MTVKKRLLQNGFASIFQKGVRVLEQLFLVPFFLTSWGAAYYGEWITLTIVPSVLAFSNLGFGTASANSFVLTYASGQKQKASNISKIGMYLITIVIITAIILSTIIVFSLDYFHIFDKSIINKNEALIAVSIMNFACLISFYDPLIESYYRAAQKAALSINLMTIRAVLKLSFGLIVLLVGYGIVEFAISQLFVTITFTIYYWSKGKSVLGLFKNYIGVRDKVILNDITKKGFGYLIFPAWQAIYFQGTTFAVRIILGAEGVAIFNTVRTLSRSVNQLLNIVSSSIFPELQYEIGVGNIKKAQKIYRFSVVVSFLIAFAGVLFLALFGLWFYNLWTQNELNVPSIMWYLFVLSILFHAFWWSSEPVFRAKNEPYKFAITGIIAALISVSFTYLFSKFWGLNGAALGALILDVIMALYIFPLSISMLNMKIIDVFKYGYIDLKKIFSGLKAKAKTILK